MFLQLLFIEQWAKKVWNAKEEMWYSVVAKALTILTPELPLTWSIHLTLITISSFVPWRASICQYFSECGPRTTLIWITWMLVEQVDCWAPAQTYWSRIFVLVSRHPLFSDINLALNLPLLISEVYISPFPPKWTHCR